MNRSEARATSDQQQSTGALGPTQLILLGMVSRQSGAAVAEPLFQRYGTFGVANMRLLFSAVFLLLIVRPSLRMEWRSYMAITSYGLCFAGMNLCFYQALTRIPLGITVTIEFLGPLAVTLATSRRLADAGWALLAAAGVTLLGWGGTADSAVGVLFAGIAGASWAGYILLGKRFRNDAVGQNGLALGITVGALISMPFRLWEGQLDLLDSYTILMGIAVAGLSSVIPYSLEFISLKNIPANIFGILMSIEPGIAAAIGLVFLGQPIDLPAGIAICCVIVASIGATRARSRGS